MSEFRLKSRDYLNAPDRKRRFNEQLFSAIAAEYGTMSRILSFGRDAYWKRRMVASLPDHSHPRCLDLACGDGDLTVLLLSKYPNAEVTALDLTTAMLELARARLDNDPRVTFLRGDMAGTGLPNSAFDVVTVGYGLRNAPDLDCALNEIRRLLKPGGVVAALDFSHWRRGAVLQRALLRIWGGAWGLIRSGNADTYGYIADSLAQFPVPAALHRKFADRGLVVTCARRYFFGFVETTIARLQE